MTEDQGKLTTSKKQEIQHHFGKASSSYDKNANLQRQIADRLIASLEPWKAIIPEGPIIELGCGTGFVTEGLAELYSNREIEVTDLSQKMIECCRQKFPDTPHLRFSQMDAEYPPHEDPHYALTVSGFTAQWFDDPALTLGKWLRATKAGGLLLISFPGNESFPRWKKYCRELGLPYTGNTLPDVEEVVIKMSVEPSQVDYYEDTVTETFSSALDFFRSLKNIGASTQKEGRALSPSELSLLIDHWDSQSEGPVKVDYHVVFLAVKKDF
ncbi:methyltransferase domain-containing protein [Fodinibius salsisoli]|uniref:Methyltransferase domain-containing protein n=1 Tax=Fodinibius salsisoli TaxID=2820877 RepID=A0ABT3PMN6_9BACT|nr:methyltransferase domain-containing protein [Fodinibius salsisoli]MCW9707207.1 methyltransferase domain-containing protein [Fodinibius salsisoli]